MNTKFKITLTGSDKSAWDVDLGVDIVDGLTPEQQHDYAEAHAVVVLQNSKLMLRACDTGECIEAALYAQYPGVKVTPHVKAEKVSKMTEEKALAKILGIDVAQVTPDLMAKAKSLLG